MELIDSLTTRERELLSCIARGITETKEIAAAMRISPNTVSVHRSHVLAKIGVTSTAKAVLAGVRMGLNPEFYHHSPRGYQRLECHGAAALSYPKS